MVSLQWRMFACNIDGKNISNLLIKIYQNFSCQQTLKAHVGAITCMSTDVKGKTLYTGGADNFIRFWDISSGKMLRVRFGWNWNFSVSTFMYKNPSFLFSFMKKYPIKISVLLLFYHATNYLHSISWCIWSTSSCFPSW